MSPGGEVRGSDSSSIDYGRCPICGYLMLPVLPFPPCGHDADPERIALDEPGVVYSWTRVWKAPDQPGNTLVMADFFDGRLRVSAPLIGADEIAIGDSVMATEGRSTPLGLAPVERTR